MSTRLYSYSTASNPAEEFNCAFLWNTSIRAQRQRERRREERREALFSLMSLAANTRTARNAANPSGIQECEEGEVLWKEDNISSTI